MERDHGWPEYIDGQMVLVWANRAEELLCDEIAELKDKENRRELWRSGKVLSAQHTGRTGDTLVCLEADLLPA